MGVLSACLPTLRPVQEHLTRNLSFTYLRGSFTKLLTSSRGTDEVKEIRLNSMEQGLSDNFNRKPSQQSFEQLQPRQQDRELHWPLRSADDVLDARGLNGVNNHWQAEHVSKR